jgi:hypothetical protein
MVSRAASRVSADLSARCQQSVSRITGRGVRIGLSLIYAVPCADAAGSYAVEVDGAGRTREVREMVQGLHSAGLRVVLDVVYNHTFNSGAHEAAQPVVSPYCRRGPIGPGQEGKEPVVIVLPFTTSVGIHWADCQHHALNRLIPTLRLCCCAAQPVTAICCRLRSHAGL